MVRAESIDRDREEKRRRLGCLLDAVVRSPDLKNIAREAGLSPEAARKILSGTADSLLDNADKSPRAGDAPKAARRKSKAMTLHTDGASRGNPGPGGAGAYLTGADGSKVGAFKSYLGRVTNNQAEYQALILGLSEAAKAGATRLEVRMDSELVVRQLTGVYKIKDGCLRNLARIVREKEKSFQKVAYRHIPRERNTIADRLSNEAIDEKKF